jgi:Fe-S cluster biosynthesis and repair protein YggX
MIGAMIYGKIAMANVWKKYVKKETDLIELKRLCCIDNTPKNTESYFIGNTLRYLKKNTIISIYILYKYS